MKIFVFGGVLLAGSTFAQSSAAPANRNTAPIVQPGAPGKSSKKLSPAAAAAQPRTPLPADIAFMQGMIMHHQQAVDMTELLRTHSQDPAMQALGKRMSISQTDEIDSMKQWLTDRGAPIAMPMDHSKMDPNDPHAMERMMMMPGMLTPEQMDALAKARGSAFDHLFLTGMIQHHNGALIMVQQLFDTPGAGQDPTLYDFATDIDNTQEAEIKIMQELLKERP